MRTQWPPWWQWEITLSPHLLDRMEDRGFNEVDLRGMLERARGYRQDVADGRWVIRTSQQRTRWEIVVEPDDDQERLVVVTAYAVDYPMQDRYLKVTYRKGKPLAAYLYLPRSEGTKSVRTELVGTGLIVDFGPDDEPIGLEITAPGHVSREEINALLAQLGQPPLSTKELEPLAAA